MKKVLIITYYWPPSGGAGVQRWMRFVGNLRKFGWEPVIYTAKDALYPVFDEKLASQLPEGIRTLRLKVPEPNAFIGKLLFWKKDKSDVIYKNQEQKGDKGSVFQKILWFIRGNLFIPDARFLWIKPSVSYLEKALAGENCDVIVSTGPPHSLHLIGKKLKEKFGIPWVADFRDPWTSMDYLQAMFLTKYAKKKHKRLEERVIRSADEIIVVGRTMYTEFKNNYGRDSAIIHNGYNESHKKKAGAPDKKFTIVHIGSFLSNRNCNDLWEVLADRIKTDKAFSGNLEIRLIGNVAPNVITSIDNYGLGEHLARIGYVAYEKTLDYLYAAQVLLLPIDRIENAEFVVTGKLFEYLRSERPVLLLGPTHGDAADIIRNCHAGYCCDFDDKKSIRECIAAMYALFLEGKNTV
ncbi:MAG: glycosyltransferase, partial [Sinomicrobium sp.]|nr:glycosyltransferase [Sinomicrobium sp.]